MVFKDWGSLEKNIKQRTALATKDTIIQGKESLDNYLREFYNTRDPDRYERTYNLMRSGDYIYVDTSSGGMGFLQMDPSTSYLTGTYSTMKVFQEAELHGSGIIGNPHFWENTMKEIDETIMPSCFSAYGFTKH